MKSSADGSSSSKNKAQRAAAAAAAALAAGPSSPESIGADEATKLTNANDENSQQNQLPFKCHLCGDDNGGSAGCIGFAERRQVLEHLRNEHPEEFDDLIGKGALLSSSKTGKAEGGGAPRSASTHQTSDEGEEYDSVRGKFPDYVNRKVIISFHFNFILEIKN